MSLNLAEYKKKAHQAVKEFWGNREEAKARQIASGRADQGERSGVTSGKNMDGFLSLIIDIIRLNGLDSAQIHINRAMLTLPGFFRPTKLWDILVLQRGELVDAIELKTKWARSAITLITVRRRRSERHMTFGLPIEKERLAISQDHL